MPFARHIPVLPYAYNRENDIAVPVLQCPKKYGRCRFSHPTYQVHAFPVYQWPSRHPVKTAVPDVSLYAALYHHFWCHPLQDVLLQAVGWPAWIFPHRKNLKTLRLFPPKDRAGFLLLQWSLMPLFLWSWHTAWVPFPIPPAITKSPTAGKSEGCAAWYRNFPETLAKYSPSAVIIRYKSFSCDKILPKVYSGYCAASSHTFQSAPQRAGSVFFIMLLFLFFYNFFTILYKCFSLILSAPLGIASLHFPYPLLRHKHCKKRTLLHTDEPPEPLHFWLLMM